MYLGPLLQKKLTQARQEWNNLLPHSKLQPRMFFIPIWEVISVPKARVDREHHLGALKGKWILDLSMFTRIADVKEIPELAHHMLVEQVWKRPQCLGGVVDQV